MTIIPLTVFANHNVSGHAWVHVSEETILSEKVQPDVDGGLFMPTILALGRLG